MLSHRRRGRRHRRRRHGVGDPTLAVSQTRPGGLADVAACFVIISFCCFVDEAGSLADAAAPPRPLPVLLDVWNGRCTGIYGRCHWMPWCWMPWCTCVRVTAETGGCTGSACTDSARRLHQFGAQRNGSTCARNRPGRHRKAKRTRAPHAVCAHLYV